MLVRMEPLQLLKELVSLPGPPQQEDAVRDAVAARIRALGLKSRVDAKGNLIITRPGRANPKRPRILVTAHLDEIALMVSAVNGDGTLKVLELGGAYPWKWGEGPVAIMARDELLSGVLSFGSTHTNSPRSVAQQAREKPLVWGQAFVFTGRSARELKDAGVKPGTRIVLAPSRRVVTEVGEQIASYFLDDRADLVAMLLALEMIGPSKDFAHVTFAATAAEEIGGDGAMWMMREASYPICVALEIGPITPENPFPLDANPSVWVKDGFSTMDPRDQRLLEECARQLDLDLHWQVMSRGGSDATCAATKGLTARPVTLSFPVENSHGYEIMHRDAPGALARLLVEYLKRV